MRLKSILVVVVILTGGFWEISHADLVQWSVAQGGNDHFYEAVLASPGIDWESAQAASTLKGGYLATTTSAPENTFLFDLVNDDSDFWIPTYHSGWPEVSIIYYEGPWLGGYRTSDTVWHWVTDEPFVYSNWAPGEPTSHLLNDQLQFFGINAISSQWDNQSHGDVANGYVIEYDGEPTFIPLPGAVLLGVIGLGYAGMRLRRV